MYVDGQFCPQAEFSKTSLSWSRQLADTTWEHANCDFYNGGIQAFGYVIYTSDDEEYTEEALASKSIAFELTPGILEAAIPAVSELDDEPTRSFKVNTSNETPGAHGIKAPTAVGNLQRLPVSFALAYDPTTYNADEKKERHPTIRCGNLLLPTEANRFVYAKMALSEYDQVQAKILEKAQAENVPPSALGSRQFYKHTVRYDARQVEFHKFELLQAQAMIEASDEFPVWKAANQNNYLDLDPPLKNLHYTNFGLDANFVVAEVFKTIELEKSLPDASGLISFSGLAKSYSPMAEGNEGDAHVIVGTYVKPTTLTLASASQHATSTALSSHLGVTTAHQSPHPFAQTMAIRAVPTSKEDRMQALGNIPLDLASINSSAQTTMANVMQWHMTTEDRKLFFNTANQPTGLPADQKGAI